MDAASATILAAILRAESGEATSQSFPSPLSAASFALCREWLLAQAHAAQVSSENDTKSSTCVDLLAVCFGLAEAGAERRGQATQRGIRANDLSVSPRGSSARSVLGGDLAIELRQLADLISRHPAVLLYVTRSITTSSSFGSGNVSTFVGFNGTSPGRPWAVRILREVVPRWWAAAPPKAVTNANSNSNNNSSSSTRTSSFAASSMATTLGSAAAASAGSLSPRSSAAYSYGHSNATSFAEAAGGNRNSGTTASSQRPRSGAFEVARAAALASRASSIAVDVARLDTNSASDNNKVRSDGSNRYSVSALDLSASGNSTDNVGPMPAPRLSAAAGAILSSEAVCSELARIVEIICTLRCSPMDLKAFYRLLRQFDGVDDSRLWALFARALGNIAAGVGGRKGVFARSEVPPAWFHFAGVPRGGLILPRFAPDAVSIPDKSGWSALLCVRVESFKHELYMTLPPQQILDLRNRGRGYQPVLLSFASDAGDMVEVFFDSVTQLLCARLSPAKLRSDGSRDEVLAQFPFKFETGRWYSLGLAHFPGGMLGRSELVLHVDGLRFATPFSFPKFRFSIASVGVHVLASPAAPTDPAETKGLQSLRSHPILGQVAAVLLFRSALLDEDVCEILRTYGITQFCRLNPGATNALVLQQISKKIVHSTASPLPKRSGNSSRSGMPADLAGIESRLGSSLVCVYSAVACYDNNAYDISVPKPGSTRLDNAILVGVVKVRNQQLRQTIRYVGGTATVLPLLGLPLPHPGTLALKPLAAARFVTKEGLCYLAEILRTDGTNQHEFLSIIGGFATVGWLLQRLPRESLTDLFASLLALTTSVGMPVIRALHSNGAQDPTAIRLLQQLVQHIWLNFGIWVETETNLQEELLRLLAEAVQQNPPTELVELVDPRNAFPQTSSTAVASYCLGVGLRSLQMEAERTASGQDAVSAVGLLLDVCAKAYRTSDDMQRDSSHNAANRVLRRQALEVVVGLIRPPTVVSPLVANCLTNYIEHSCADQPAMQGEALQVLIVSPLVLAHSQQISSSLPRVLIEHSGGLAWLLRILQACISGSTDEIQHANLLELWIWSLKSVSCIFSVSDSPTGSVLAWLSSSASNENDETASEPISFFVVLKKLLLSGISNIGALLPSEHGSGMQSADAFVCSCFEELHIPLLELAAGICVSDSPKMHPFSSSSDSRSSCAIRHTEMLALLFELAVVATNVCLDTQETSQGSIMEQTHLAFSLQQRMLRDVSLLLSESAPNRKVFSEQPWQSWLFALLATCQRASNVAVNAHQSFRSTQAQKTWDSVIEASTETAGLCLSIFRLMHYHALSNVDGWQVFGETQALLKHFADRLNVGPGGQSINLVMRLQMTTRELEQQMIIDVFNELASNRSPSPATGSLLEKAQTDLWVLGNLVHFCGRAADFVLFVDGVASTGEDWLFGFELDRDTSRHAWKDFGLACKILRLIRDLLKIARIWLGGDASVEVRATSEGFVQARNHLSELRRVQLWLVVVVLNEVDRLGNQEAERESSSHTAQLQQTIATVTSDAGGDLFGVSSAVANYVLSIRNKLSEQQRHAKVLLGALMEELRELLATMTEDTQAEPFHQNQASSPNASATQVSFLFTVAALTLAMRTSHAHGGSAKDMILELFTGLIARLSMLASPGSLELRRKISSGMSKEDAIAYVVQGTTAMDFEVICSSAEDGDRPSVGSSSSPFCLFTDLATILRTIYAVNRDRAAKIAVTLRSHQKAVLESMSRDEQRQERSVGLWREYSDVRETLCSPTRASLRYREHVVSVSLPRVLDIIAGTRGAWTSWKDERAIIESNRRSQGAQYVHEFIKLSCAQDAYGQQREYVSDKKHAQENTTGPFEVEGELTRSSIVYAALLAETQQEPSSKLNVSVEGSNSASSLLFECRLVRPMHSVSGKLHVSPNEIVFCADSLGTEVRKSWSTARFRTIKLRRYGMVWCALELVEGPPFKAHFFSFVSRQEARSCFDLMISFSAVSSLAEPDKAIFAIPSFRVPSDLRRRLAIATEDWRLRKMTNFDYLMKLNDLAGRTRCDLAQWPVFPWVLSDYKSEVLDLDDPASYRDLSKPVGALNESNLASVKARYKSVCESEDMGDTDFLHGTHYSSPSVPLFFLIRLQPFARHALTLQGGKWDHRERMFTSLDQTWSGCLNNPGDNKELIPELFYLPDLFHGSAIELDQHSTSVATNSAIEHLGNVELPPWASASPEKFVSLHRAALESDYVSSHLHQWIDLIFGASAFPRQAALDADNLFHPFSYEEVVQKSFAVAEHRVAEARRLAKTASGEGDDAKEKRLADAERDLRSLVDHVQNFGQTPAQLFDLPHPPRLARDAARRIAKGNSGIDDIIELGHLRSSSKVPPVWMHVTGDPTGQQFLTAAFQDGTIATFSILANLFEQGRLGLPLALRSHGLTDVSPSRAGIAPSDAAKLFVAVDGHLARQTGDVSDHCISIFHSDFGDGLTIVDMPTLSPSGKPGRTAATVFCAPVHGDVVTCLSSDETCSIIATGSSDTTVRLWSNVEPLWFSQNRRSGMLQKLRHSLTAATADNTQTRINLRRRLAGLKAPLSLMCTLIGHDHAVTCVSVSTRAGLVASGSSDGSAMVHTLSGVYVRTLCVPPLESNDTTTASNLVSVSHVILNPRGHVVVVFCLDHADLLCVFEDCLVSGECIATTPLPPSARIQRLQQNADGTILLAGLSNGYLCAWNIESLDSVFTQTESSPVTVPGLDLGRGPISAISLISQQRADGVAVEAAVVALGNGDIAAIPLPPLLC